MTPPGESNHLLLNYHDAVLYESDLHLFESPTAWLNDACMNYGVTRLQQQNTKDVVLMDPAVLSFLMHQCTDHEDLVDFMQGNPTLFSAKRILCPINDGHAPSQHWQRRTGTHWSLLVIDDARYLHFDSVAGNNHPVAQAVANKFASILKHAKPNVMECPTPQQANGYDCGLHVLAAMEELAQVETLNEATIQNHQFNVRDLRRKLADEVREHAKEYAASR